MISDQQNRWVGQVGFRIRAVDLMRDQDGSAEDQAGNEPPLGTGRCSDVVEAGADAAENAEH